MIDKYLPIGTVCTLKGSNKKTIANFQFDENGVIIFDSSANLQTGVANPETKDTSINNPFNIEYKSVARAINPNKDQILSPYTFDENGIITGDKLAEAASPFVFDENGVIVEEKGQQKKPKYEFKFDENGIIIDEKLVEDLDKIVEWQEILKEVNIEGVEPMYNTLGDDAMYISNEDIVEKKNSVEEILANAPESEDNYFLVPKVIKEKK